ncbi:ferric-dicitrate binding protein FerR (iron transport regulator) [Phenylobacterium koreense]|uniref:Ferric-dicitrate binding protein FerR (Iron transport regulator) n=2 Tax=Phenylobacterium koreense TaxID=266125 RepID=A0ABV2ENC7_9CAUL
MREASQVGDALTLNRLKIMGPSAAAALLRVRQAAGMTGLEAQLLANWLASDPANALAWQAVDAAWSDFDTVDDDELLCALREDARRTFERPQRLWGAAVLAATVVAAVVVGLVVRWSSREARQPRR